MQDSANCKRGRIYEVMVTLFTAALLLLVIARCASKEGEEAEKAGSVQQAVSSAALVMGFESAGDWGSATATLVQSELSVEGDASLAATITGYSEITSVPLATLGAVAEEATLDAQLSQPVSWGDVRLVLKAPSIGQPWRDRRWGSRN